MRMIAKNDLDVKNKEQTIAQYTETYGNQRKSEFIYKFWGDKKTIKTYPNVTIQLKDGKVVYVKDLLPEIQPYAYKFQEKY